MAHALDVKEITKRNALERLSCDVLKRAQAQPADTLAEWKPRKIAVTIIKGSFVPWDKKHGHRSKSGVTSAKAAIRAMAAAEDQAHEVTWVGEATTMTAQNVSHHVLIPHSVMSIGDLKKVNHGMGHRAGMHVGNMQRMKDGKPVGEVHHAFKFDNAKHAGMFHASVITRLNNEKDHAKVLHPESVVDEASSQFHPKSPYKSGTKEDDTFRYHYHGLMAQHHLYNDGNSTVANKHTRRQENHLDGAADDAPEHAIHAAVAAATAAKQTLKGSAHA